MTPYPTQTVEEREGGHWAPVWRQKRGGRKKGNWRKGTETSVHENSRRFVGGRPIGREGEHGQDHQSVNGKKTCRKPLSLREQTGQRSQSMSTCCLIPAGRSGGGRKSRTSRKQNCKRVFNQKSQGTNITLIEAKIQPQIDNDHRLRSFRGTKSQKKSRKKERERLEKKCEERKRNGRGARRRKLRWSGLPRLPTNAVAARAKHTRARQRGCPGIPQAPPTNQKDAKKIHAQESANLSKNLAAAANFGVYWGYHA